MDLEKKYPSNADLEREIIATCCRDNDCLSLVPANVADMFHREDYKEMMTVILKMYKAGQHVDMVTVGEELNRDEQRFKRLGGMQGLLYAVDRDWSSCGGFEQLLKKLIELYKRRELIYQCEYTISKARDLLDEDYMTYIIEQTEKINRCSVCGEIREAKRIFMDYLDELIDGKQEKRILFGIGVMDRAFNGVTYGTLNIIGGRTGMGKTAVALAMARNMYLAGNNILYFNLEMTEYDIMGRLVAGVSGIPYRAFTDGRITEKSQDRLSDVYSAMFPDSRENHFYISSEVGLTVDDVCRIATVENIKSKLDAVFVDYLGRLSIPSKGDSMYLVIGDVVRKLKNLAMKLNVAVFLLVQGNRENEHANNKRMTIASIAGSDIISHEADNIFLLYREGYYTQEKSDTLEINHVKARKSFPRTFQTLFSMEKMRFEEGPLGGDLQSKRAGAEVQEIFKGAKQ